MGNELGTAAMFTINFKENQLKCGRVRQWGTLLTFAILAITTTACIVTAQENIPAKSAAIQYGDGPNGAVLNGKPITKGWKSLIDGQTLKGWQGEKGYWEVKEGAIVGASPPGTPHHHYLLSTKDYSDFELHVDVKLVGYNSGVCIRIAPETYDSVPGYQVDMGDGYWGCLWEEHKRGKKVIDYPKDKADAILHKDDWNHYYVRAVGHNITIFLNSVKTGEVEDPEGLLSGPLGFQLCHGGNEVASFKNMYIKLLKPAAKGTSPAPPEVVVP